MAAPVQQGPQFPHRREVNKDSAHGTMGNNHERKEKQHPACPLVAK